MISPQACYHDIALSSHIFLISGPLKTDSSSTIPWTVVCAYKDYRLESSHLIICNTLQPGISWTSSLRNPSDASFWAFLWSQDPFNEGPFAIKWKYGVLRVPFSGHLYRRIERPLISSLFQIAPIQYSDAKMWVLFSSGTSCEYTPLRDFYSLSASK